MKNKIEEVFNALQELEIKPTPHNVSILDGAYSFLRQIYKELEEGEHGAEKENGPADHPG